MKLTKTAMAAMIAVSLLSGCSWHRFPKPVDCAAIGAGIGAFGGGAGAAEHADESRGEAAAIGVASTIAGGLIAYGICRLVGDYTEPVKVESASGAARNEPMPRPVGVIVPDEMPTSSPPIEDPPEPRY